jgi:hypothetical protein
MAFHIMVHLFVSYDAAWFNPSTLHVSWVQVSRSCHNGAQRGKEAWGILTTCM